MEEQYYMIADWSDPTTIRAIGTKMGKPDTSGFCKFSSLDHPVMVAFTFPESMVDEARQIATKRQVLKHEYDTSMGLVYKFLNKKSGRDKICLE